MSGPELEKRFIYHPPKDDQPGRYQSIKPIPQAEARSPQEKRTTLF